MKHEAINQVLNRAEKAKTDSDFTYFFSLLLAAEAIVKIIALGIVASIADDKDRNRYRLEYALVRADGIGDWAKIIEDALAGPASQYLLYEARIEQVELTQMCKQSSWQYDATFELKKALELLNITVEEMPVKSNMKRWFRLFATLRNKTRGHGATKPEKTTEAAKHLAKSIDLICCNFHLFNRPWAFLHRNLSGKYRVTPITENAQEFDFLKKESNHQLSNGVYLYITSPRQINLMSSDSELQDFFFANGGANSKTFELLSYSTDDKLRETIIPFLSPPGVLPASETKGHGELQLEENCFTNVPKLYQDYINRADLQKELYDLLIDDRRSIITLVGCGGIGKTSLALRVIKNLYDKSRYTSIIWLSARDVDLKFTGPKSVRPEVLSQDDMSKYYSELVLSRDEISHKDFNARKYFEEQLQSSDLGPCLFVLDNFETTENPIEIYNWVETFIRSPNKVLITTRLREFKGDYPVEVSGMSESESRSLIDQTAEILNITDHLNESYIAELTDSSEGHPYVLKILLGEVAKKKRIASIPHMIAGTEDILTALFERTYAVLSPCAQRAYLTLSAWNSPVPKLALEAVLCRSTKQRNEVEKGIESLLQYSVAELHHAPADNQEFINLPLVASVFGKKKLNITPSKHSIKADVEILQMLGPSRGDDMHLGLVSRLETFLKNISLRIEKEEKYEELFPVLEMICRSYNPGWLLLARWHIEQDTCDSFLQAKEELHRFLENSPSSSNAIDAWNLLSKACAHTDDALGEIHALVERAQISSIPFDELSSIINKFNRYLKEHGLEIDKEQKIDLAGRLASVMEVRKDEASANDLSRMAWLEIHLGRETIARDYVLKGLQIDSYNSHLKKLESRLKINI